MSDLCMACGRVVGKRQHGITCDVCDRWQHRVCGTGNIFFIIRSFISAHLCIHNYFLSCRILTKIELFCRLMIDFPFQTYLFIYSLCTTPKFSEKQNKHYLKFYCFFALKGELNRKILLLRFLFCLAYIYIPQSLSYSTVTLKTGNINKICDSFIYHTKCLNNYFQIICVLLRFFYDNGTQRLYAQ